MHKKICIARNAELCMFMRCMRVKALLCRLFGFVRVDFVQMLGTGCWVR